MKEQYPPYFRKPTWRPDEVADFFGVSKSTIYRWEQEREDFPPSFKVGHTKRWRREVILEYYERRAITSFSFL